MGNSSPTYDRVSLDTHTIDWTMGDGEAAAKSTDTAASQHHWAASNTWKPTPMHLGLRIPEDEILKQGNHSVCFIIGVVKNLQLGFLV